MPLYSNCFLQGSQRLEIDNRIEIRDEMQSVVNRFPISDYGAVSDQGEFFQNITLDTTHPSFVIDESLTGYTGTTAATDVDIIYIATNAPVLVKLAYGIPLNAITPGSRNPNGAQYSVSNFLLLRSNTVPGITLEEGFDQRLLPLQIRLQPGINAASVTIYMTKFSQ